MRRSIASLDAINVQGAAFEIKLPSRTTSGRLV
jgi:hypothetical protein